jgi:mannose-6-phosphate isomerase-like protein (cupin superfamily)
VLAATLAGNTLIVEGASLVLAEWRDPGGATDPPRDIAPLHVHHCDDEAWYVLEGAQHADRLAEWVIRSRARGA